MQRKSTNGTSPTKSKKGNSKNSSPESRPRRRASQTYFIKYQLARNPLKAEEQDLKLALIASLEDCNSNEHDSASLNGHQKKTRSLPQQPNGNGDIDDNEKDDFHTNTSQKKRKNNNSLESNSKNGRPKIGTKTKSFERFNNNNNDNNNNEHDEDTFSSEDTIEFDPISTSITDNGLEKEAKDKKSNSKRRYSTDKTREKSSKKSKVSTNEDHNGKISITKSHKTNNVRSKTNHITANGNLYTTTSIVHNNLSYDTHYGLPYSPFLPIQKKEPLDEEYLRKYKPETEDFLTFICYRTTLPNHCSHRGPDKDANDANDDCSDKLTDRTEIDEVDDIDDDDAGDETRSVVHNGSSTGRRRKSPYDSKQQVVQNNTNHNMKKRASSTSTSASISSSSPSPKRRSNITNGNNISNDIIDEDSVHISPIRRPIRQSPRLAKRQTRKFLGSRLRNKLISEHDHSSQLCTAYENPISYEEDLERASNALEDMAQEINNNFDVVIKANNINKNIIDTDSLNNNNSAATSNITCTRSSNNHHNYDNSTDDGAQIHNLREYISKTSSSQVPTQLKNNRHFVKGLMTKEFASGFADEETIFDIISNHKI